MEYSSDVVYQAGKEHVVLDFLSRIYLVDLTVPEGVKEDSCVAAEKIKIYVLYEDQSRLLKQAHRLYTGHLRSAKLFAFISQQFFWTGIFKDVQSICDSCLTCAQIHSTVDYCRMKLVEAVYLFQIVLLTLVSSHMGTTRSSVLWWQRTISPGE